MKFYIFLLCFMFLESTPLEFMLHKKGSGISVDFLSYMKNTFNIDTFIETGTCLGGTTLQSSKVFNNIYSVELSKNLYQKCKLKLSHIKKINLYCMNSIGFLRRILPSLKNQNLLIFLDAHYSAGETEKEGLNTPISQELQIIFDKAPDSVIMIDDIFYFQETEVEYLQRKDNVFHESMGDYPSFNNVISLLESQNNKYKYTLFGDLLVIFPSHKYPDIDISPLLQSLTKTRTIISNNLNDYNNLKEAFLKSNESELNNFEEFLELFRPLKKFKYYSAHQTLWEALLDEYKGKAPFFDDIYFLNKETK